MPKTKKEAESTVLEETKITEPKEEEKIEAPDSQPEPSSENAAGEITESTSKAKAKKDTKKKDGSSAAKQKPRKTKKSKVTLPVKEEAAAAPQLSEDEILLRTLKPKQFTADGSSVFRQDVETKYKEELEEVSETMQKLLAVKQKGRYLTTKVIGVRRHPKLGLCALCTYGEGFEIYQILIPFEKFTSMTDEDLEKIRVDRYKYLERRLDTTIDVVLEGYEEIGNTYIFYGNRIKAMKMVRYEYWHSTERRGSQKHLAFNIGSLLEARIVGVYPKTGVAVEIYGVETLIPYKEISYLRIRQDLKSLGLRRGGVVTVRITNLYRDENDPFNVKVQASIKRAGPDPRMIAFDMVEVGDRMRGEVTLIQANKKNLEKSLIFIALENNGEAVCERFETETVKVGDKVSVTIAVKKVTQKGEPIIKVNISHVEQRS